MKGSHLRLFSKYSDKLLYSSWSPAILNGSGIFHLMTSIAVV